MSFTSCFDSDVIGNVSPFKQTAFSYDVCAFFNLLVYILEKGNTGGMCTAEVLHY